MYENILTETLDQILIITINRPDKLNALNKKVLIELESIFNNIDLEKIRVVILTGSGEKAFVAGADISELAELDGDTGKEFALFGQRIFNLIENFTIPVICLINGYALGGGCELAMSCHIRIASENAKLGQPELNLGIIPGYGGTQRLTRLVNKSNAMQMILTGDLISANEAYRIGLISKVVTLSDLTRTGLELARKITEKSPISVRYAIEAINSADFENLEKGLETEAELFSKCCSSQDFKEGTQAFLNKRKPVFKGI